MLLLLIAMLLLLIYCNHIRIHLSIEDCETCSIRDAFFRSTLKDTAIGEQRRENPGEELGVRRLVSTILRILGLRLDANAELSPEGHFKRETQAALLGKRCHSLQSWQSLQLCGRASVLYSAQGAFCGAACRHYKEATQLYRRFIGYLN